MIQSAMEGVRTKASGFMGAMSCPTPKGPTAKQCSVDQSRQSNSLVQQRENSKEVLEILLFLLSNNTPGVVYWSHHLDLFTLSLLREPSALQTSLREMIDSRVVILAFSI